MSWGVVFAIPAASAQSPDPCINHADGALCNDQNPCTLNDICQSGWCKGVVAPNGTDCTDGNLCTTMDRCVFGLCVGQLVPEGDPCDDGNHCTTGEACRSGLCMPQGNLQCNDNDPCTSELCIPATGCVYAVVPMCMAPDAGTGGTGGSGGSGGTVGNGGMSGQGGSGGAGGSGGMSGVDAGVDGGAFDALADAPPFGVDAGTGAPADAGSNDDADAITSDAARPMPDSIAYKVEGGAWLCAFRPGSAAAEQAVPVLVGFAFLIQRLRRRSRAPARRE